MTATQTAAAPTTHGHRGRRRCVTGGMPGVYHWSPCGPG
jgi:hypothetical protein